MVDWIEAAQKAIDEQIESHSAAIEKLRTMRAGLGELAGLPPVAATVIASGARPISLKNAVTLALQTGPATAAEVIAWVKGHFDSGAKPHSIRSTLAYLKKHGKAGRGGKNWYLTNREESPADG